MWMHFRREAFLLFGFENYYEGEIRFERGLPVTSKIEKSLHGYGLKSLRYTVHKYKGEVQIDARDNWFSLRILIPLEVEKTSFELECLIPASAGKRGVRRKDRE